MTELWETRYGAMVAPQARDLCVEEWRELFDALVAKHNMRPARLLATLRDFADEEEQFQADLAAG
jgi:hypothetical protein